MNTVTWGSICFGLVIGWVTYRTLRRTKVSGLGDIAVVIGAVGGGAVTRLFPEGSADFAAYGIGLAIGFFSYFIVSLVIAHFSTKEGVSAVNEWLGESANTPLSGAGSRTDPPAEPRGRSGGPPPMSRG